MRWLATSAIGVVVGVVPARSAAQPVPVARLEHYLEGAMKAARVPGVAVVIVQGDSVVLAKGYGRRAIDRPEPVDSATVFAIGSATKSFTAATVAMLVDEGRLSWDDRVAERLPGLELADPYVTRELTVRDLLSHRSGLPRCDIWYGAAISRAEVIRRIRFCPQAMGFRAGFGYQNVMFLTAGQLVAALDGRSWDDFVAARILRPLGMNSTTTSIRDIVPGNVASPHAEIDDEVRVVPWRNLDNVAPAGALNSTVADLAQWLRFLLGRGALGGRRLLSADRVAELWRPTTIVDPAPFPQWRAASFLAYGLGWFLWDHRGRLVIEHSGGIDGMSSDVALVPELNLGVAVLSNLTESPLPGGLANWIVDVMTGAEPIDWVGDLVRFQDRESAAGRREWLDRERARVPGTRPSLAAGAYAGRYADSLAGSADIVEANGRLALSLPEQGVVLPLEHWHYDTFDARWPAYRLFGQHSMVTFEIGSDGRPRAVVVEGVGRFGLVRSPR